MNWMGKSGHYLPWTLRLQTSIVACAMDMGRCVMSKGRNLDRLLLSVRGRCQGQYLE